MKIKRLLAIVMALLLPLGVCGRVQGEGAAQIYLLGEAHGIQAILEEELARWQSYYEKEGLRHLFVELPYYTGEYLNQWMAAGDDAILEAVYRDWEGTLSHTPAVKAFYQQIKALCPETVFHGTDVGHQYDTTGARFLKELLQAGQADSDAYRLTREAIAQGERFYQTQATDPGYRENQMAENFIRAFDSLGGESVMGIYGSAHTGLDAMDHSQTVPSMASQLKARYGSAVRTEDLSWLGKTAPPQGTETLTVNGKAYEAAYYGVQDLREFGLSFDSRAFWRLENAYDDFAQAPATGDVLPYDNYPMAVAQEEVFVIDYTRPDGTAERKFYRSGGKVWQGRPVTEEFMLP